MRKTTELPVGSEVRSSHGNHFVKVGENEWQVRSDWGVLDGWTLYADRDVMIGRIISIGTGECSEAEPAL